MATAVMSDLERIVYAWLTNHAVAFDFQAQIIGGYDRQLGDAIADFLLWDQSIILRVQGGYWHTGTTKLASDIVQKMNLQALGYTVVDVWEKDIKTRLETVMKAAIEGVELTQ